MAWSKQLGKDCKGSRPRCVLVTEGSCEEVAARLTKIVCVNDMIVSPDDEWMPRGKPVRQNDGRWDTRQSYEFTFSDPSYLASNAVSRKLLDWWLIVPRDDGRSRKTPTWDIASTCTIRGKRGLLLVEAKAHKNELKDPDKSGSREPNRSQIGEAIQEANRGLEAAAGGSWKLAIDDRYQLSNRFAWSWKLASLGVPVVLVYLGFLSATEMASPQSSLFRSGDEWEHAVKSYSDEIVPGTSWGKWIDVGDTPLLPVIRTYCQPFSTDC